ncbi:hypothetical protein Tco_1429483 [Tanacetum coccineum]
MEESSFNKFKEDKLRVLLALELRNCYNLKGKLCTEFPQLDSGLAVPTFQQGEDLIDCINKAMAFLSAVASRFPPLNNQLKTSSNPRNQATIQDGTVTVQQCTQPKRPRSSAWFKEKLMLAEAQEAGQILDEEQLAFIVDFGIAEVQVAQHTIPQNSAFQTEDLDAYDSDYDDISSAKVVLMANLSSFDFDVLSNVSYSDTYLNDMINRDVQEMPYSEQTHIMDFLDNEITSDSNIIPYSQYLQESQDMGIQDTNSSAPNDLLVLSLVEQITDHVANLDKENQTNKMLSAEQAFWLKHSKYNPETSVKSHTPVRIEASSELPKMKLLKFKLFFNQMEAAVDQCSVNKNAFKIQIKQLSIDDDQLLNQIMSQEIMHIAVNSVDILNVKKSCVNACNKCLEKLDTELLKKNN